MAQKQLILASTSRYRQALLSRLGVPFEVRASGVDEQSLPGELPAELAQRLACAKAAAALSDLTSSLHGARHPADAVVIGSDQVASLDGTLLRKPGSHDIALRQLLACQGREVVFHTAVAVLHGERRLTALDETVVRFRRLGERALNRYLLLDTPYDCAGGFKVEGPGIALFEEVRSSDPTALIGLPLIWLSAALASLGIDPLGIDASTP
jgi:septum formation protein